MSNFYSTSKANIKNLIAGILLVIGLLISAFANQWSVRQHLVGFSSRTWPDRIYHRLQLTRDGSLVGVQTEGTHLNVDHFGRGSGDPTRSVIEIGQTSSGADLQSEWVLDREAQRLAYATPQGIAVRPLCDPGTFACAGSAIVLPAATRSILAFQFIPGRMLAAAFNDGTVLIWDTETGNQVGRLRFDLDTPDQARFAADYLSVVSSGTRTARVYRIADGPSLKMVEESRTPPPPFKLITPGIGQLAFLSAGGVYYRGATRNSPGTVHAAALGDNDLLVGAGDFDGLYVLAAKEDPYVLVEDPAFKPRATAVAADASRFAYSGAHGTGLVGLTLDTRVTATGRRFNFIGLGLAAIGGLLAASSLLFDLVGMSFKAQGSSKKSKKSLLEPDPSLVKAFADGNTVLWAGSGLSAQAGFPSRPHFVVQTLQTADSETWVESPRLHAMYQRVVQGHQEEVLNELIETLKYQRSVLIQHFKVVYCRFTPMSPCHKIVRRLPVAAAVTTNYDGCLEQMGPMWANNVLTIRQGGHRGAAEKGQFFLLRLYGDPRVPADVKLSRKEFIESVKVDATLGDTLQTLFDKKTMFFVGCSAEGLVADLKAMPKITKTTRKHYAVIGVGATNWERYTQILEQEYGIDCVVCSEDTIGSELPRFLEILATEIEAVKSDRGQRGKNVIELSVKRAGAGSGAAAAGD